jgi:pyridinium-3,5-biscarboxylic acid mononucleotide sulfurtransferase
MTTMTTSTTSTTRKRRTSTSEHRSSGAADKDQRLRELLSGFSSAIVAFSGGVDSAYLSVVATQVLGSGALCVTADSPSYPEHHRSLARQVAGAFALRHEVVSTAELERPEYRANPVNRCYYCKQELYSTLTALATTRAIDVVLDGNNADDRGDYRPGRQAAREHGVRSPLDEVGLTKQEIRDLSRAAGMATWDEPASACLSSRIPYDTEITDGKLRMVEQAETALRDIGFRVCRVRHHDTLARLELGTDEIARALDPAVRDRVVSALRGIGYRQVTVDLQGYRTGSLNEGIRLRPV